MHFRVDHKLYKINVDYRLLISVSVSALGCIRPMYLYGFYNGLFPLKSCSLSVPVNLSFSCGTIINNYSSSPNGL